MNKAIKRIGLEKIGSLSESRSKSLNKSFSGDWCWCFSGDWCRSWSMSLPGSGFSPWSLSGPWSA